MIPDNYECDGQISIFDYRDNFIIDPKVAEQFVRNAAESQGMALKEYLEKQTPLFREKSQSELIADGMKDILNRMEKTCGMANLYANKFVDIYHDELVVRRNLNLKLVKEFFKAGFIDACYRLHLDVERLGNSNEQRL